MVGNIGNPSSVPKPAASAVDAALNLLIACGRDKGEIARLLTTMREVQKRNEAVLAEAQTTVREAERKTGEATEAERRAAEALTRAEAKMARAKEKFTAEKKQHESLAAGKDRQRAERASALDARDEALTARERVCAEREVALNARDDRLAKDEARVAAALERASDKEATLDRNLSEITAIAARK